MGKRKRRERKIIERISLNHCFTCDKGFSSMSALKKHFQTKQHRKLVG